MLRLFIGFFCICLLAGCESWQTKSPPSPLPPTNSQSEISALLSARRQFCALPDLERAAQIVIRRDSAAENQLFELLLLASCDPARTPGVLRNTLEKLANHAQWTQEKQALFNLIQAQSKAYDLIEGSYQNLKIEFKSLEAEHKKLQETLENTIKGIQQIESDMDTLRKTEKYDDQ